MKVSYRLLLLPLLPLILAFAFFYCAGDPGEIYEEDSDRDPNDYSPMQEGYVPERR